LLHRPDPLWEGEEIAEAFQKLRLSGKVRYFGVSNQNRFQMEYLQSFLTEPLVANQVEMSLLHHGFVELGISFNQNSTRYPDGWEGTMEYCRTKPVLLQAWSPLAQGILMGNLDSEPENIKMTATLVQEYARRHQTTAESILLAWLLKHPAKIQPVLGTTRPDRLRGLCQGAFHFSEPRRMVLSFCRGPGSTHALKRRGFRGLKVLSTEMQSLFGVGNSESAARRSAPT